MESHFSSGEKLLEFFHTVERLKLLQRAGWKKPGRDIQDPESVSDHSHRMTIMAMMSKVSRYLTEIIHNS
jgi:5'-deoxynucleotidase YfbR-like HD superfamily hydrolase